MQQLSAFLVPVRGLGRVSFQSCSPCACLLSNRVWFLCSLPSASPPPGARGSVCQLTNTHQSHRVPVTRQLAAYPTTQQTQRLQAPQHEGKRQLATPGLNCLLYFNEVSLKDHMEYGGFQTTVRRNFFMNFGVTYLLCVQNETIAVLLGTGCPT